MTQAEAASEIARLSDEQQAMLSQIRRDLGGLPPGNPVREQKLRLLAKIEAEINAQGGLPRRRYVSPATVEQPFADYYHALVRRIEDQGTGNFPSSNGRKLYGDVTLNLTIDAQGRVIETELVHGSGNALLDRKAAEIARSAAPFGTFSDAMSKKVDQIVTTAHFHFAHIDGAARDEGASRSTLGESPKPH